jgi:hypothetical protein
MENNIANIPNFPEFVKISIEHKDELGAALRQTKDGVSEFTFGGLYLFRKRYDYKLSCIKSDTKNEYIISGERDNKKFFMTPQACPSKDVLIELFKTHDYWKDISDSVLEGKTDFLRDCGIEVAEDRGNFDYLYLREDLAKLSGKKFHKKKNLVNAFLIAYPEHSSQKLTKDLVGDAITVLDRWKENKQDDGDYVAAKEALELFDKLSMEGAIYYVNNRVAGYCLGESVASGSIFAMHFEKGIEEFKGIYQFINQNFAETLDESFTYINREQDLDDEGLRQAKMTYRPVGFVKKYSGKLL